VLVSCRPVQRRGRAARQLGERPPQPADAAVARARAVAHRRSALFDSAGQCAVEAHRRACRSLDGAAGRPRRGSPRARDLDERSRRLPARARSDERHSEDRQQAPAGHQRHLWLCDARRRAWLRRQSRGRHEQAAGTSTGSARLLRPGRSRGARPGRGTWDTSPCEQGLPRPRGDRSASRRGSTGRRAVQDRRLHRNAARRTTRAQMGRRRSRTTPPRRTPRIQRLGRRAHQNVASTLSSARR